jgi:hypothetical protein
LWLRKFFAFFFGATATRYSADSRGLLRLLVAQALCLCGFRLIKASAKPKLAAQLDRFRSPVSHDTHVVEKPGVYLCRPARIWPPVIHTLSSGCSIEARRVFNSSPLRRSSLRFRATFTQNCRRDAGATRNAAIPLWFSDAICGKKLIPIFPQRF